MNQHNQNQEKNKTYYEKIYSSYNISNILRWINNLDSFLDGAIKTEISWHGLYMNNFRERIKGKKVLEMGCGDCVNAAVMAALGAQVYANDIASASGEIVRKLNENCAFQYPIVFIEGDFLKNNLESQSFDFVIGKAFLHHLTIPVERLFFNETVRLLKPHGEARFFEPAVNSRILDEIRWHIPIGNRPSKFSKQAFQQWKENDPHPNRSFSSKHWEKVGTAYFRNVEIYPLGTLERFSRLIGWGERRNKFKRFALKKEHLLPEYLNRAFARSQLIVYKGVLE